ncbi:MAG: hypothetical protein KAI66_26150, partial [Lentisphaeria bacterium]|nr:hypothetical protein [Lentisphaeria bacterium]
AVTEPEAITFETLCFFFAGYEGSFVYTFPRGYDNRYWQAIANANQFVATYEDIVLDRKEFTDFSVSCETPTPGEVAVKSAYFPNAAPLRIIQSVGFQRGDTRLLAVGNFWQRGECFFRLKVKLPEGAYVLRQPDRNLLFSNPSGASSWRASELASGALLHVGALRWACFTVEPADADTEAEALSQAEIRSCMSERMPAIQTAFERAREK